MDYTRYTFKGNNSEHGILIAFLGELPFEMFEEDNEFLKGFITQAADNETVLTEVVSLCSKFGYVYSKEKVVSKNWNKEWESNFHPVLVEGFCGVRADFHPPFDNVQHEIIIKPEMAFGTGHHATTFMMMEYMESIPFKDKSVFDYGCGTGILAILAGKLGAEDIDAVDIEEPAYRSTIENAERNGTPFLKPFLGTLENVPVRKYDIILANINRNVILQSLSTLHERLNPGGMLLTSGYIPDDEEKVKTALVENGFIPLRSKRQGNWIAGKAFKRY